MIGISPLNAQPNFKERLLNRGLSSIGSILYSQKPHYKIHPILDTPLFKRRPL